MATQELSIKLLINKNTGKLCFAEAGSDVVEFLMALLSLPLGTITSLLATYTVKDDPWCPRPRTP
jgi:hypothetical protein